jgi:hypothetical protein
MAVLSERLRRFREQTGQSAEPLPKEEEGATEGDFADYVMPISGISRRVLSKVAEKGMKEAGEKVATEVAKKAAKESVTATIAKESAQELGDAAKRNAAKGFLGKIEADTQRRNPNAKPMPGEAPFKGELPGPAGQKVGANKPPAKEGPALNYKDIQAADKLKRSAGKKKVPTAETIEYSRMSNPVLTERKK